MFGKLKSQAKDLLLDFTLAAAFFTAATYASALAHQTGATANFTTISHFARIAQTEVVRLDAHERANLTRYAANGGVGGLTFDCFAVTFCSVWHQCGSGTCGPNCHSIFLQTQEHFGARGQAALLPEACRELAGIGATVPERPPRS